MFKRYYISTVSPVTPDASVVYTPRRAKALKPAVILCPTTGGQATQWISDVDSGNPGWGRLAKYFTDAGYVCIASDHGGAKLYGNTTAQVRTLAAYNYAQTLPGVLPGPCHFVGTSMGGMTAIQFARYNRSKVASIIGIFGMANIEYSVTNNLAGLGPDIRAAYGMAADQNAPSASDEPFRNPSDLTGLRYLNFVTADDGLVPPVSVQPLIDAIGSTAEMVVLADGIGAHSNGVMDGARLSGRILPFLQAAE